MAVYPVEVFTEGNAIVGRSDQYGSSTLGKKFLGQPKGVYIGFTPSVTPPSEILTLEVDPSEGFSCIKLPSSDDPAGLDLIIDRNITIDFTGQPAGDYPIAVIARAFYAEDGSSATSASLVTQTYSPITNPRDVLVAIIDGPSTAMTLLNRMVHSAVPLGTTFQVGESITGADSAATADVLDVGTLNLLVKVTSGSFVTGEIVTGDLSTVSARNVLLTRSADIPLALGEANFGFMPSGSIESLQAATDIVNEIVSARIGLDSTVYEDLSARLAGDQTAASMAGRLGVAFRVLRSNDYDIAAGEESIIVSGSFSEVDRDHNPMVTLGGSGSESTQGAVASPIDQIRNVCVVQDANSGYRPIDDPTDRLTIYGRLEGPDEIVTSGSWTFTNALRSISGVDSNATTELQVGDTITGPDGLLYEIDTIGSNTSITLRKAFVGSTATSVSPTAVRWLLSLRKLVAGVEQGASLPPPTTIRFFSPSFLTMENSNFDYVMAMHTSAEREPLPDASETVPGAVRLATSPAFLGSVNIQNVGVTLPGGPFHTLNFNSANASVAPGIGGDGELDIVELGLPGPTGPSGVVGGPGPTGPDGPGFSAINVFERSSEYAGIPGTPGSFAPFSFTRDVGHTIRNIEGGIAMWRDFGFFAPDYDEISISSITGIGTTIGQLDADIKTDVFARVFISTSGD